MTIVFGEADTGFQAAQRTEQSLNPAATRPAGDRALVMPFVRGSGAPDVGRMAIVRSEAFADVASFERAVEESSSCARG